MKYYAGIGSRFTPRDIQEFMTRCAAKLEREGWILRSGGAEGADQAFAQGVVDERNKEVYLPWPNFNGQRGIVSGDDANARIIAEKFHPAWGKLSEGGKKLQTRNVHQVLGGDLRTFSRFVLCWTPNGRGAGGTGQAIRIAKANNIEVWDLGNPEIFGRVSLYLDPIRTP